MIAISDSLAGLKVFRRAVKLADDTRSDVMPGYPPMSPVTDSFFDTWSMFGVEIDAAGTRWADVALGLAGTIGVREDVRAALAAMCNDPYVLTITVVDDVEDEVVRGRELGVGDLRVLHTAADQPASAGSLVLAYNVLDESGARHAVTTPYLLSPTQRVAWQDYLNRVLPGDAAERTAGYQRLLRRGPARLGWIEYVFQSYCGHTDVSVELRGVPDQPLSRPHSQQSESIADERQEVLSAAELERPGKSEPLIELRAAFWHMREFAECIEELTDFLAEIVGVEYLDLDEVDGDISSFVAALALYGDWPDLGRVIDRVRVPKNLAGEIYRETLKRMRAVEPALLEVQEVEVDTRVRVKNLLSHRTHWVYEKLASRSLKRFDTLLAFTIPGDGRRKEFEGALVGLPPGLAPLLRKLIREAAREAEKLEGATPSEAQSIGFLHGLAMLHESRQKMTLPEIRNTDGHELVDATTRYRVSNRSSVLKAVARLEHFVEEGEGAGGVRRFALLSADDREQLQGPAVLAHIEVSKDQLIGRCNSRERLHDLRDILDRLESCAHLADSFEDMDIHGMAGRAALPREPETMPPEMAAATAEVTERHLFQWLDTEVPALGGLSPREAVAMGGSAKKAVIQMLKEQELGWERRGMGVPVDFPGAWRELGLRHPTAPG